MAFLEMNVCLVIIKLCIGNIWHEYELFDEGGGSN